MAVNSVIFLAVWVPVFGLINLATCTFDLDFRVIPTVIKPLETRNVTLRCFVNKRTRYSSNTSSEYYFSDEQDGEAITRNRPERNSIVMIRILKNFTDKWQPIAEISYTAPKSVHKLDASISITDGTISSDVMQMTFILVRWNVATSDVFGKYRCDVISFDNKQTAVLTTSSEIGLGSSLNALDFLRLLKHDMTDIRGRIHQQEQGQRSDHNQTQQLKSELQTLEERSASKQRELDGKVSGQSELFKSYIEKIERRISDMESQITKRLEEISLNVNYSIESAFFMLWPKGSYGLLQPESGCPLSGITTWETGWIKHHTESTDRNIDEVSTETHLPQPALERENGNNFLTQHFCIKADTKSLGRVWPKGSYCIIKKGKCPDMFDEGYVKWDEENDGIPQTSGGSLPDGIFNDVKRVTIEYCCRQDGPADVPIYLPNLDPFYLYRYGGKCQQVHDMHMTEEFVLFDTENTNNHDEFSKVHPDGRIKNIRLELCYYRKG